jgi:hypothetical protein
MQEDAERAKQRRKTEEKNRGEKQIPPLKKVKNIPPRKNPGGRKKCLSGGFSGAIRSEQEASCGLSGHRDR